MREYPIGLPAEKIDVNSLHSETMHKKNFIIEVKFQCDYHQDVIVVMSQEQLDTINTYPIKKIKFHTLNFSQKEVADIKKTIEKDANAGNPAAKKAIDQIQESKNKPRNIRI